MDEEALKKLEQANEKFNTLDSKSKKLEQEQKDIENYIQGTEAKY